MATLLLLWQWPSYNLYIVSQFLMYLCAMCKRNWVISGSGIGQRSPNTFCSLLEIESRCWDFIDIVYICDCFTWLKENGTIPFIFRTVIESSQVEAPFLTIDCRTLNYTNPNMPMIMGSVSREGLLFAFGKFIIVLLLFLLNAE